MSSERKRPKAYVVGGGFDYIRLLYNFGCNGAKGLDDADFVLFTGGEDVNPELYGEVSLPKTHWNRLRDDKETAIYKEALGRDLPMVGICRGGQFLNVMNGGKLWQHVNNHALGGNHLARIEIPPFIGGTTRRTIGATSTHHQMMRPTKEAMIILTATEATTKDSPGLTKVCKDEDDPDVEGCWYEETHCLCFQPHPEYGYATPALVDFFEECLETFIYPNMPLGPAEQKVMDLIKDAHKKLDEDLDRAIAKDKEKKATLSVPKTKTPKKTTTSKKEKA